MVAREKGRILCCSFYISYISCHFCGCAVPPSHQWTPPELLSARHLSYVCITNASAPLALKYLLSWLLWGPHMLISVVPLLPHISHISCVSAHANVASRHMQRRTTATLSDAHKQSQMYLQAYLVAGWLTARIKKRLTAGPLVRCTLG